MSLNTSDVTKRLSHSHAALLYQEKFDTWLNLRPLMELQDICVMLRHWPTTPIYKGSVQIVGYRSLQGLQDSKVSPRQISKGKVTPLLPAMIIKDMLTNKLRFKYKDEQKIRKMFITITEASMLSVQTQVDHLLTSIPSERLQWTQELTTTYRNKLTHLPKEVVHSYLVYEFVLEAMTIHKELSGMARKDQNYVSFKRHKSEPLKSELTITPDIIIWKYENIDILLHRSAFLEVFNKLTEMQALLLYAWLQTSTSMSNTHYNACLEFWRHMALKISSFFDPLSTNNIEKENKGFAYAKCIEGLGVSELILRGDTTWGWTNDQLGQVLWEGLHDNRIVHDFVYASSDLKRVFDYSSVESLAEYIGTVKVMGHPSIEIEKGLDALYEKTHRDLPINVTTRDSCVGILTRDIIRVFYNKYNRYPSLILTKNASANLTTLIASRRPFNSIEAGVLIDKITPLEWAEVRFVKNDEFEEMDNRLALLKDKALGLTRSKVVKNWISSERLKKNVLDSKAILNFLFGDQDDMDLKTYMKEFCDDEWSDALYDYLVIKLTAKELELKDLGRFFGSSPAVERDRRIVGESNVMRFMSQLIPDQLLTPNELEVLRKLVSFRDYRTLYPNCYIINISFDFSSWNNSMRSEVVDVGAGRILDPWFGINYYNKTMKAYENMLVYYDDGIIKRKWEGQLGGIEGLNQATWSIVFIGGIKFALEKLGYKYSITVKGDDVRAAIIVPKSKIINNNFIEFRTNIMNSITLLCKDMGWSLNPNESFVSLSLIATSKQYLYNDTWLPSSMKKIMKICSHTNGVFVSLEDIIATIFSIAHSACSQTTVVMPSFVTASFTAASVYYRQLPREMRLPETICLLLLWPQILSGPGPLPLQTFFVRGENDMLSAIIALYRHILVNHDNVYLKALIRRILSLKLSPTPNEKMVLGDPYCIDIESPDRPESVMKRQLKRILKRRVKQQDIKALLSHEGEQMSDNLVKILRSARPYYAKVMTAIWESSPFYLLEELLSKFTHSSTVMGFFSHMKSLNSMSRLGSVMWRHVVKASRSRWLFWLSNLQPLYSDEDNIFGIICQDWLTRCPTEITNIIRCHQWGDMRGLTYPSLVTQNIVMPEIKVNKYKFSYGLIQDKTYSTIQSYHKKCVFQTPSQSHHYAHDKHSRVWLGATTSQKLEYVDIPEATQSPVLRKLKLLLALRKSSKSLGPTITPLIDRLIKSYTDIDIEKLSLLTPINNLEHFAHRVPINSFSLSTMPNCRPNISQLCYVDNESFDLLREDTVNRSINLAARQYYSINLVTFPLQYSNNLGSDHPESFVSTLHHDIRNTTDYEFCPHCCANVDDEVITFPDSSQLNLSNYQQLPLISCGRFEKEALLKAIHNVKLDTALVSIAPHIDSVDDREKVSAGLRLIVQQHMQICMDMNQTLIREGIVRGHTTSDIVDNLLLSEGKKSLNSSLVSLNVWRSVNSGILYSSLLAETYAVFLTRALPYIEDLSPEISRLDIPFTLDHSLAIVFERLVQISGLPFVNEGVRRSEYTTEEIDWGYYLDHVNQLSHKFIHHHWMLFHKWYNQSEICPFDHSIMLYNNDENFIQGIQSKYNYVMSTLLYNLRLKMGIRLKDIRDIVEHIMEDPMYLTTHPRAGAVIRQYILHAWVIEIWIEKPWDEDDPQLFTEEITSNQLDIFTLKLTVDDEEVKSLIKSIQVSQYPDIPYHMNQSLVWSSIKTRLALDSSEQITAFLTLFKTSIQSFTDALVDEDSPLLTVLMSFKSQYQLLTNYRIYRGALTECERIIKSTATVHYPSIEEGPIIMRLPSHRRVRDFMIDPKDDPYSIRCRLSHRVRNTVRAVSRNYDHVDLLRFQETHLQCVTIMSQIYSSNRETLIDGVDIFRVFGHINKAYLRWVEILIGTKINWLNIVDKSNIVILGDGGGSVTRWLLDTFHESHVIFCDKKTIDGPGSATNNMEAPVELLSYCRIEDLARLTWKGFVSGDITHESTRSNILAIAKRSGRSTRLIISDIVPDDLRIEESEYIKIIYGILQLMGSMLAKGGICILRIPLLRQVDCIRIILVIMSSFAHVHVLTSYFDRPELLSVYIIIHFSSDEEMFAPDVGKRLFDSAYPIGLDNWDQNNILIVMNRLKTQKTSELFSGTESSSRWYNINFSYLLRKEPVCPLSSVFSDWSNHVLPVGDHLCDLFRNLFTQVQPRISVILQSVRSGAASGNHDIQTLSKSVIELLVLYGLYHFDQENMCHRKITHLQLNNIVQLVTYKFRTLIKPIIANVQGCESLRTHNFEVNKIPLHVCKHLLRIMSWFSLQYHVQVQRYAREHPWYYKGIRESHCMTCTAMLYHLPAPVTWSSVTNLTLDSLLDG